MKSLLKFKEIVVFIAIVLSLTTYVNYNQMMAKNAEELISNDEVVTNID